MVFVRDMAEWPGKTPGDNRENTRVGGCAGMFVAFILAIDVVHHYLGTLDAYSASPKSLS